MDYLPVWDEKTNIWNKDTKECLLLWEIKQKSEQCNFVVKKKTLTIACFLSFLSTCAFIEEIDKESEISVICWERLNNEVKVGQKR